MKTRLLGRDEKPAVWPWLLFAVVLFGLVLLGLVGAVADLQAGPAGMVIGTGLIGLGMAVTRGTVNVEPATRDASAIGEEGAEIPPAPPPCPFCCADAIWTKGAWYCPRGRSEASMACTNTRAIEPPAEQSFEEAIRPIVDRVRVREMRVAEALRRYHEGSDRGELKALLIEMWGPPVEATAAEKEASPRCGRTTVILAKRRICVLPASHDGVHEDDVGAWWTEGESDPVFAREAAAHPTMMGLAGGGSPSVGPMCMNCNEAPRGERCAGLCFRCANGFEVRREVERLKPSVPTGRGAAGLESAIGAAIELSEAEPGVTFHVYGPMREDSDWLRASVKDAKTAPNSGVSRWR